jgi:hypothetical protein
MSFSIPLAGERRASKRNRRSAFPNALALILLGALAGAIAGFASAGGLGAVWVAARSVARL